MPEADPPLAENCHSCGSAAFPNFRGGTSSPPAAAKAVRTNSIILHQYQTMAKIAKALGVSTEDLIK